MKLDSTPLPDFADDSKTERPVLLVNSKISSSVTYRSGISMPVLISVLSAADLVGLAPDSPTTEVLYSLLGPV